MVMSSLTRNRKKKTRLFVSTLATAVGFFALFAAVATPSLAFAQAPANPQQGNATQTQATANQTITGSINVRQAVKDLLNENLNATFVDAADTAENQVANGTVISGRLGVLQGYLVYGTTVADLNNNTTYNVIIDPSTGRVLVTTRGAPADTVIGSQAGKSLLSSGNLTMTLVDAADAAEGQFATGTAIGGSFEVVQGNPVYNITVADVNNGMTFQVTVDPRTGNVLTTSQGTPMGDMSVKGVF